MKWDFKKYFKPKIINTFSGVQIVQITKVCFFWFTITMELIIKGLENFEVAMQMLIPNMWQEENLPFQIFTFGNPPNLWATHTHIYIYIKFSRANRYHSNLWAIYIKFS